MRDQKRKNTQNKPNSKNNEMNITSFTTMNYEQITMNSAIKNKPNSNPIKPNFTPPTCASEDGYQRIKKEYKKSVIPVLSKVEGIRVNPWLLFYCKTNPIKPNFERKTLLRTTQFIEGLFYSNGWTYLLYLCYA
jgi:hypothetical protein